VELSAGDGDEDPTSAPDSVPDGEEVPLPTVDERELGPVAKC